MELGMHIIIHGVLALFLVIELGLIAYCMSDFKQVTFSYKMFTKSSSGISLLDNWPGSAPSAVYFIMFNTIWSGFVLIYVAAVPIYAVGIFSGLVATVLEGITSLFWFSGSLSMAVWVRRGVAVTAVAFGFMILILFLGLFINSLITSIKSPRAKPHI